MELPAIHLKFLSKSLLAMVLITEPKTRVVEGGWIGGKLLGIKWYLNLNNALATRNLIVDKSSMKQDGPLSAEETQPKK